MTTVTLSFIDNIKLCGIQCSSKNGVWGISYGIDTAVQASCYQLPESQKRTCKRPPSPKCSTSRMLSDCMKAVGRNRKFPWGLDISKQCHAGWWFEFSVCARGSLGVYQIWTQLLIRQHKGLKRQGIITVILRSFAVWICLEWALNWGLWRTV